MSQLFAIAVGIILVGCFLIWAIKVYIITKMEHRANEWRRQRAQEKRKADGRIII